MFRFVFPLFLSLMPGLSAAAPDGEELFAKHCAVCHGDGGAGGVGVPLALSSFIDSVPDAYLRSTIREGRPGRIMPAFAVLSDAQVDAIVGYMRGWSDKAAPAEDTRKVEGDVTRGSELYAAYCSQCHGDSGTGGSGTGVTFSRKRDLPIIAPSLSNPGFLRSASDSMIRDAILLGRDGTPMTSALVTGLSEEDVDDIVAYIRSLEAIEQAPADVTEEDMVITVGSDYSLEQTVENLKQAISDQNFTLIRTVPLDAGLVDEGRENRKQVVLHFCNFKFLFDALAVDPRVGLFLPCRVTVVEDEAGKVRVMAVNPKRLSSLFNNRELDEACDRMHDIYSTILEDAIL